MAKISELAKGDWELTENSALLRGKVPIKIDKKQKVNILALGDVGATLLLGLKLMGGHAISSIGIWDINEAVANRYECEMNQIERPFDGSEQMPKVHKISDEDLFDCDVFIFCASKGVPPVGSSNIDVRMVQYAENKGLVEYYGKMAVQNKFQGIFAVVSDPVDPLCKAVLDCGLSAMQVKGYGLGVMNSRAMYFANNNPLMKNYVSEGRAFGPHGGDLVIADSIPNYNHEISMKLTELTVEANLKIRELGFKPYIAPAISSGAMAIILTIEGSWHYSSTYLGEDGSGAFLGAKNRFVSDGIELEDLELPNALFDRIKLAYENLGRLV